MKLFVTGISSGIGREIAIQAAGSGSDVWGIARRNRSAARLPESLGPRFHYLRCDTGSLADRQAAMETMAAAQFHPDAVVLNAGIFPLELDLAESTIQQTMQINLEGALAWVAHWLPSFIQRGQGHFLAVSSLFALWPDPGRVAYSASKAALSMAFRGLRLRHGGQGVRFSTIFLGPVASDGAQDDSDRPKRGAISLIARPEFVARHVLKLLGRGGGEFFCPPVFSILPFIGRWMPDRLFAALLERFQS